MVHITDRVLDRLARMSWKSALNLVDRLTPREQEVFLCLSFGPSNQELADALGVSERTVRAHLTQILTKLRLDSRLKVCLASYEYGRKIVANDNSTGPDHRRMLVASEVRTVAGR